MAKFHEGYLTRFGKYATCPLLVLIKQEIQGTLNSLPCAAGGRDAYLRALRAFFAWAVDNEFTDSNTTTKVSIKVPKPLRLTIELDDRPTLLARTLAAKYRDPGQPDILGR